MAKYISGRSKKVPLSRITDDRYRYLSIGEAEPDLGDPLVGPSSIGAKPIVAGTQYMMVGVEGYPGERYWIPNQGGVIPGSISVFDENGIVGTLSSVTQLNFKGAVVRAEEYGIIGTTSIGATVTVFAPGNDTEVIFNSSDEFSTDTRFAFDNGLLSAGDRITVGTGGTVITTTGIGSVGIGTTNPTQELHLQGDLRLTGTIYDSINEPGDTGDLLVKTITGGLLWVTPNSVNSGAGGTIGQIQFHNTAGLVDGADDFYFDYNNNRVGIGTTNPTRKLDVEIQTAIFSNGSVLNSHPIAEFINLSDGAPRGLEIGAPADSVISPVYLKVSGTSNRFAILDQNDHENFTILDSGSVGIGSTQPTAKLDVNGTLNVSGISTFTSNVDVDGTTDLDVLNVSETASFTYTLDNTLGDVNTGSVQLDGGAGIAKNLTVGQTIQATNLNITGIGTIATFDFGIGDFDNITVTGVSTLGNIKVDGSTIYTNSGTLTLDSNGNSVQVATSDRLVVNSNQGSTSTSSGAFTVVGGVGIGENLYVGGSVVGTITTATNLAGGAAGSLPYQNASGSTTFLSEPNIDGRVLTYNNTTNAPQWSNLTTLPGAGYTLEAVDSGDNAILRLSDGSTNDDVTITAGTGIVINPVAAGGLTISANINYTDVNGTPTNLSEFTNDAGFATTGDIPTNVSDLTNDSGFATTSDIPTNLSELNNDAGFATTSDIPTNVSDLTNDSGFATTSDIPTNLSELNNDVGFTTTTGPAGTVIYTASNSIPTGYLKANGATLNTTTYADLFAAIGYTYGGSGSSFKLPDLRGEFIRGWDDGRGADNNRTFGSFQDWAIENITGSYSGESRGNAYGAFADIYSGDGGFNGAGVQPTNWDFDASREVKTSTETRPRNVALLALIKY